MEEYENLPAVQAKLRNESELLRMMPRSETVRGILLQNSILDETFVLIFLKQFNADLNELVGIQPFNMRKDSGISTLTLEINSIMGWDQGSKDVMPAGTTGFELMLFKESPFGKLDMSGTFAENFITRGDIIWFWRAPLPSRLTTSIQILTM